MKKPIKIIVKTILNCESYTSDVPLTTRPHTQFTRATDPPPRRRKDIWVFVGASIIDVGMRFVCKQKGKHNNMYIILYIIHHRRL